MDLADNIKRNKPHGWTLRFPHLMGKIQMGRSSCQTWKNWVHQIDVPLKGAVKKQRAFLKSRSFQKKKSLKKKISNKFV